MFACGVRVAQELSEKTALRRWGGKLINKARTQFDCVGHAQGRAPWKPNKHFGEDRI